MAALNCRPGDLAFIVDTHPALGVNGKVVKLADQPPKFDAEFSVWEWRLEEPIDVIPSMRLHSVQSGAVIGPGDVGEITEMPDCMLRPIRNPGDDAVDEMVAKLGPAPMTLIELREWSNP